MQLEDFNWFKSNYDSLYSEYGNSFLAIKNKCVIGKYNSFAEAVRITSEKEEAGTFIVQKCDGTESAYTNYIATVCFA